MPGIGHHEVIVEMPEHTGDLSTASPEAVRAVLETYRARYRVGGHSSTV